MLLLAVVVEVEQAERQAALTAALASAAKTTTGSASRVCRAVVMEVPPSFDRGEVTEKGSLNQRALRAGRTEEIAKLYAGGDGVIEV